MIDDFLGSELNKHIQIIVIKKMVLNITQHAKTLLRSKFLVIIKLFAIGFLKSKAYFDQPRTVA